ncbi:MAG: pantetheine-phosphate adenylyltransferase [Candidatus Bathyarchaeota archaeon]|nr:pantetheine-phosphate adenylyltransferase [Candidatus Bathyarchaeota archaeon]
MILIVKNKLKKVVVAGTFDIIHKGHEKLISMAFEVGEFVLIGLTTDEYANQVHKNHPIDDYLERRESLENYLKEQNLENRSAIVPLNDPYGPAIDDSSIEGIIVSCESIENANIINNFRGKKGLKSLQIFSIEIELAENGKPISTTRIRKGKIEKNGKLIENKD